MADKIAEKLDNINQTLREISDNMPKPDHPFLRGMIIAGIAVGIFGILQPIDIIVKWLGG